MKRHRGLTGVVVVDPETDGKCSSCPLEGLMGAIVTAHGELMGIAVSA